jgi:hypothetical protein
VSDAAAPKPEASTESSLSKRTVANRRNAQKSTGPKTPEGKRKSSLNAVKHGLLSKEIFSSYKDDPEARGEYRRLLQDLQKAHPPADAVDVVYVERMAVAQLWSVSVLRYTLRETQRAIKIGGKRLPEHIQEPAAYDLLLDYIREDPEGATNLIAKALAILDCCLEQIKKNGYLDGAALDLLRSVPGGLYMRLMAFASRSEDKTAKDSCQVLLVHVPRHASESTTQALLAAAANEAASTRPERLRPDGEKILRLILEEHKNLLRGNEICILVRHNPELRAQLRRPDLPEKEAIEVILRFGAAAERKFDKALDQLERRQRRRLGEAVPSPVSAPLTPKK